MASSSSWAYRDARGQFNFRVTGGTIYVTSVCAVTGRINVCDAGFRSTIRIQYAQMARDWNIFTLVGYSQSNPDVVSFFDAVKR